MELRARKKKWYPVCHKKLESQWNHYNGAGIREQMVSVWSDRHGIFEAGDKILSERHDLSDSQSSGDVCAFDWCVYFLFCKERKKSRILIRNFLWMKKHTEWQLRIPASVFLFIMRKKKRFSSWMTDIRILDCQNAV